MKAKTDYNLKKTLYVIVCYQIVIKMSNKNTGSMYAENILLLGAGFTKNFGGLLASEMWAEIFNNEKKFRLNRELKKINA